MDTTWIDVELLTRILRNAENDDSIRVTACSVSPATSRGDNYRSEMHRVIVRFSRFCDNLETEKSQSLIFKVAPKTHDSIVTRTLERKLYETEINAMSNALPKMNEILKSLKSQVSPRTFHTRSEEPTYIVMEDLAARGFRMSDRRLGLDLEHCIIAVRNLARFHASSVALREKEPKIFKDLEYGMFNDTISLPVRTIAASLMKDLAKETSEWPELRPNIPEKLVNSCDVPFSGAAKCNRVREGDFQVLTHGDCWLNNLLFSYDEQGKPIEQIFVDFQYSAVGTPALDVIFFLSTTPNENVRTYFEELLIREYHFELTNAMEALHCTTPPPSFDEFQRDLRNKIWYRVAATLLTWPTFVLSNVEVETLRGTSDVEREFKESRGMSSKIFRKFATKFLNELDSQGLFDAND